MIPLYCFIKTSFKFGFSRKFRRPFYYFFHFKFYNTINSDSTFDSSTIDISINIIIDPPFLKNDSSLSTITHPAGTYISDLSLIENVSFFSKFDEFYYYNNQVNDISISYSETNFTLSFEKLETTISQMNNILSDADLYTKNIDKFLESSKTLEMSKKKLDELETRWLELDLKKNKL